MATVSHLSIVFSTSNVSSYTSSSFNPQVGDLLVVMCACSGTVAAAPTMTDSQGNTYALVHSRTKNAGADTIYTFVCNSLIAAAVATTVTFDCSADPATGCITEVVTARGMTRTGAGAVRQVGGTPNGAAAGTPAFTFPSAVLTGNPTVIGAFNGASPATLTPPTSWTEFGDTGYSTPTTGGEFAGRNSGFTGTTVTWGSTSATAWGTIGIELDSTTAPIELTASMAGAGALAAALTSVSSISVGTMAGIGSVIPTLAGVTLLPPATLSGFATVLAPLRGVTIITPGTMQGLAAVSAALTGLRLLDTVTMLGQGSLLAALTDRVSLAAALAGLGTLIATLRNDVALSALLAGQSIVTADLTRRVALTALFQGQGDLQAALTDVSAGADLSAFIVGSSSLAAELRAESPLTATMLGEGSISTQLTAVRALATILAGEGDLATALSALVSLEALIAGQGVMSAEFAGAFEQLVLRLIDRSSQRYQLHDRSSSRYETRDMNMPLYSLAEVS